MKILAIQNLYPPQGPGGCGISAEAVVDRLRQRGHIVLVLTSTYGCSQPVLEGHVWRVLRPYHWAFISQRYGRLRREVQNQRSLHQALQALQPDVALVWSLSSLSLSILLRLQELCIPIIHYLHDHWLLYWHQDPWRLFWTIRRDHGAKRFLNWLLSFPAIRLMGSRISPFDAMLDFDHCMFVSTTRKMEYLEAGFPVEQSPVISNGIDMATFQPAKRNPEMRYALNLLCVSTVLREKGIQTAIEAVGQLYAQGMSVSLTIVGPTIDQSFHAQLREVVDRLDIAAVVAFLGTVPHDEMAFLYQSHDVFLLPSIVPEGLPLVVLEAMACGLPVVATNNGGQTEVVNHEQSGFLFEPGDVQQLVHYISELSDPNRRSSMGEKAHQWVVAHYDWEVTVSQVEQYLAEIVISQ